MRTIFRHTISCLLLLFICFSARKAHATHVLGAELFYEHVSTDLNGNESYKVTLKVFGDCSGGAFNTLLNATPTIQVRRGNDIYRVLGLIMEPYPTSHFEITPVCPEYRDSTKCSSMSNPLEGIKRYVYSNTITLNERHENWQFIFAGALGSSNAGRSTIIDNVVNSGGNSIMALIATLNNQDGPNSSPVFTSDPTPFFCLHKEEGYNLGAIDPDGDQLTFSMVGGLESSLNQVPYISPYTPTAPFATDTFHFNTINGQMYFVPNLQMNGIVVNKVEERKNGVVVGTSMREMTFVIISNCENEIPSSDFISGLQGGFNSALNEVTTCDGQNSNLSYKFDVSDPDGDLVGITFLGLPHGANAWVENNNTPSPSFHFEWDLADAAEGTYTYYVTLTDNGCPISRKHTVAQTIVVKPLMGLFDSDFIAGCRFEQNSSIWVNAQFPSSMDYTITWWDSNTVQLQTTTTKTGDTLENIRIGTYTIHIRNTDGCVSTSELTIPDPGYYISFVTDTTLCENEEFSLENTSSSDLINFVWDFGDGNTSTAFNPTHTYPDPGSYTVRLIGETAFPCLDTGERVIVVDTFPEVSFSFGKDAVCEGERIFFDPSFTSNADSLEWLFSNEFRYLILPGSFNEPISHIYDATGTFPVAFTAYYPNCPDSTYEMQVRVLNYPVVNLRSDTSICPNAEPIELFNLTYPGALPVTYLWNTGDVSDRLLAFDPGVYSLTATTNEGLCSTSDSVLIARSCYISVPNIFTPNGDGMNDYFFPRELLSMRVTAFHMRVYNRWGQLLFETRSTDGRGWDGRFNGELQPGGVYVYTIQAQIDNRIEETLNGNVTLLR